MGVRSQCIPASPPHSPGPALSLFHRLLMALILAYFPCSLAAEPCRCSGDTSKLSRVVTQWSYQVSPLREAGGSQGWYMEESRGGRDD